MPATDPGARDDLRVLRETVDAALESLLESIEGPAQLTEAMRYAVLGGGKRIRPILCLATCRALSGEVLPAIAPALAIELVHAYSLVHDDLPCMDDDDERRGRPTVHKAYGESLALLVGDALLTEAFACIAGSGDLTPRAALDCVITLGQAAGTNGMVGGQVLDILVPERTPEAFRTMHDRKTGALFSAAIAMGAIAAGASPSQLSALSQFGAALGEAFQISDDLLDDAEPTSEHEDDVNLVSLLGRDGSLALLDRRTDEALAALAFLGEDASEPLAHVAVQVRDRVPRSLP